MKAAGRTVLDPYVFPGRPTLHAEYGNITTLAGWLRTHDAIPIAVASGTLNDIVKRASHECDRPYLAVATAASVDGYTSFGASITKDGYKQTLTCPAPARGRRRSGRPHCRPGHHDRQRVRRPTGQGPGRGRLDRRRRDRGRPDRLHTSGSWSRARCGRRRPGRPSWLPATARDAGARRGADDVRAGDAGFGIVPAGVRCRALLQPSVGAGGIGPRCRRRTGA